MGLFSLKGTSKEEKSWILYDVANSAFILMAVAVFPIYFSALASEHGIVEHVATAYWGFAISLSTFIVAFASPILGALGDYKGKKRKLFAISVILGVVGCALLGFTSNWYSYLIIFIIARLGFSTSLIYYDAMLVDTTTDDQMDHVSALGFGYGYIGSCIPFVISIGIVLVQPFGMSMQIAIAIACMITAVWWLVFTIPLLRHVKQRYYLEDTGNNIKEAIQRPFKTLKKVKEPKYRPIFLFILAYFCYIDGVYTVMNMSTSYGMEVGIPADQMILALLAIQVIAFPAAIFAGKLSAKIETMKILKFFVALYIFICLFAFQMSSAWEFWFLAVLVGLAQGGLQALSRSYFGKIIPKRESNEFFGFYDIFGKCADVIGPAFIGVVGLYTGSSRYGILGITILFVVGYFLLHRCETLSKQVSHLQKDEATIG